jgi:predicted ATPase
LAHDVDDPALLAVAQTNMQITLYPRGELAVARDHGEQALARFATSPPLPLVFSYGPDPAVRARSCAAVILHALGYLDQARQRSREALALAHELGHVQTLAATLQVVAGISGGCREWAEMQAHAAAQVALAATHGLPFWWALGTCDHGIALAQQGNTTEGIAQIRQGLAVYRAAGSTLGITRILGWLAEVCAQTGQLDDGFATLADAFMRVEQNDEHLWEAELYRRKGELTLHQSNVRGAKFTVINSQPPTPHSHAATEAEAYFQQAIEIARRQQAKLFELRAAVSLARLKQQTGNPAAAHKTLAEIFHWFTEGFDTADLQDARALLEKLR